MENQQEHTSTELVEVEVHPPITPSERILAPLELSDYSQFLYETNYGGKKGQDFTAEGIKTIGLSEGISTSNVRIEFINDAKTQALFYCVATDRHGNTSEAVVKQCELEHGRINPHWIEKGSARAERNAIKKRLPVQLMKTALQKAIAAGEAKQSAIIKAQQALSNAWCERDERLIDVDKRAFFNAAQREYGESELWDADGWKQITDALMNMAQWVADLADQTS